MQLEQPAPDFTLFDQDKKEVRLSDLKGHNVLLLFFPLAFTRVCTAELCTVRDNINKYDGLNAKVFGISVDSPYTLAKFREEEHLNFSLLSDFNREASKAYNVLYETFSVGMKDVSKRAAFIIDVKGNIKYREVLENAGEQPDFKRIQEKLEQLTAKV